MLNQYLAMGSRYLWRCTRRALFLLFLLHGKVVIQSGRKRPENLEEMAVFVPGIRVPGTNTADYLDYVLRGITVLRLLSWPRLCGCRK